MKSRVWPLLPNQLTMSIYQKEFKTNNFATEPDKAKFANVRGQQFNGVIVHNAARVEVRQIEVSERDLRVCDFDGFAIYVHGFDP
jgi:hypothetical protein